MQNSVQKPVMSRFLGKNIGNIKITDYIGEGSMGIVFKGRHNNLDIDVAIKIIKDELLTVRAEEYLHRFEREARIAAKLNHRCITRIIDYGEFQNKPYIVIEYIDGFTLSEFVKAHKTHLTEENILKLMGMTASALHEAHSNDIIHRDLKPQNIMVSKQGRPYITDLGLAKDVTDMSLTQTSMVMGSPVYMAPECFTGEPEPGFKSDIYSLGCIAYFTAFKELPVKGKSMQDIMHKHMTGQFDFELPTACSDATIKIIKKMMAFKVEDRYQSSLEVVNAIKNALNKKNKLTQKKQKEITETVKESNSGSNENNAMESTAGIDSFSGSDAFLKANDVLRVLEERLGPAVSSHGGSKIIHASIKDRLVLWALLIGLIACGFAGYFYTN